MKLSIIIPAYNEEKRILPTLEDYNDFFKKELRKNFELIIVPNNCKDNTFLVVQDFAKNNNQIKILNLPFYTGKGGAIMAGFKIAKGEYIGFTDADNSTTPENYFKLYENIGDYDGIIASRRIKGAVIEPKRKIIQEFSSYSFHKLANLLFNLNFKDTQCGAKLFTKETTDFLIKNYTETGWIFDVDLLHLCKKNKLNILEYPIKWSDSEGSKLSLYAGMLSTLKLVRFRLSKF